MISRFLSCVQVLIKINIKVLKLQMIIKEQKLMPEVETLHNI